MKILLILALIVVISISGCTSVNQTSQNTADENSGNEQVGLNDGNLAPDFSVTDIDGKSLTNDALKGKPAMLFFTTTWCTPCQVGASNLARSDDETGGDMFNVAILFVDSAEEESKLRDWKQNFGRDDWYIAYADGMADTYQVQYLDTKYVIDKNGVIQWKNLQLLPYETAKQVMGDLI